MAVPKEGDTSTRCRPSRSSSLRLLPFRNADCTRSSRQLYVRERTREVRPVYPLPPFPTSHQSTCSIFILVANGDSIRCIQNASTSPPSQTWGAGGSGSLSHPHPDPRSSGILLWCWHDPHRLHNHSRWSSSFCWPVVGLAQSPRRRNDGMDIGPLLDA